MLQQTYYACTILSRYVLSQEQTAMLEIYKAFPNNQD
jgi:hypothetical protein